VQRQGILPMAMPIEDSSELPDWTARQVFPGNCFAVWSVGVRRFDVMSSNAAERSLSPSARELLTAGD